MVFNQSEVSASRTKAKITTGTAVFRGGLPVFRHSLHTPRVAKYLCLMFPNQEGAGGTGREGGHVTYPAALVSVDNLKKDQFSSARIHLKLLRHTWEVPWPFSAVSPLWCRLQPDPMEGSTRTTFVRVSRGLLTTEFTKCHSRTQSEIRIILH